MTNLVTIRLQVIAAVLLCISVLCYNLGMADEDVPLTDPGKADEDVPLTEPGIIASDPAEVAAKGLLCFHNKYIYSSCEEAYRLTESGIIKVPPEYVEFYCSGPCLSETELVLNCVENIVKKFVFYNKATIKEVKDTIKAGCSYGPEHGNFDVAEHLLGEGDSASKTTNQLMLRLGFMITVCVLLL